MKHIFKNIFLLVLALNLVGCSKDDETQSQSVKTKVKITGYRVDNFSFTAPDGLGWDGLNGYPDVYSGLFNGTNLVIASNVLSNVTPSNLPINVTLTPVYLVPDFSNTINIVVMDYDENDIPASSNDEIGFVPFILNDYTIGSNKYPTSVTKTSNGVTVTLFLTWE